ncbi:TIGR02530 family flagellar biosynthesis protein [Thermosediminibacter oceani]|uniref:Flagellar operon protein n=1 Tax=Thermosediminibacter oceani (strain ATCC BAA-1034 / DSM 16646 / JW/IW-1228P) TaxID=555079 RepID=D9S387_THEOJ|nr:TIGR02530 family flagellar biosynthesis protein [Thermosediminibacter oceani]ADL07864.1 flagellar operon protein [Thermosediminibacter oceani DSM 16646]
MDEYIKISPDILYSNRIEPTGQSVRKEEISRDPSSFQKILEEKLDNQLKISKHAQLRMSSRNINLTPEQVKKLNIAVEKAEKKGVRESLILMNDIAFIVSVKNKTIITAVDGPNLKENVFTNIDGAVIM